MGLPAAEAMQTAVAIEVADRNSRDASLTLAFAQPGDTLSLSASFRFTTTGLAQA
jgi:hypothetical protein